MSKPNLLAFSTSVGFYRNKRVRDLRRILTKSLRAKVSLAELSPMLFQVVMAYAGENQIDGNFAEYSTEDWIEIFATNHIHVGTADAAAIVKGFHQVGLFEKDKIRSWMKYNRHLADYEGLVKARRRAGKLSAKRRELETREALRNGHADLEKVIHDPQKISRKTAPKNDSITRQIWLLNQQLESTTDERERKKVIKRRLELTRQQNQIAPEPTSPAPPPQKPATKVSAKKWEQILVENARQLIADGAEDTLTENMVRALIRAGDTLPPAVRSRYSQIASGDEAKNPVPE